MPSILPLLWGLWDRRLGSAKIPNHTAQAGASWAPSFFLATDWLPCQPVGRPTFMSLHKSVIAMASPEVAVCCDSQNRHHHLQVWQNGVPLILVMGEAGKPGALVVVCCGWSQCHRKAALAPYRVTSHCIKHWAFWCPSNSSIQDNCWGMPNGKANSAVMWGGTYWLLLAAVISLVLSSFIDSIHYLDGLDCVILHKQV